MKRQTVSLDGVWRFSPDPHADGEEAGFWAPGHDVRLWAEATVPSCFEAACPELDAYSGICWYRRTFAVPETWLGRRVSLCFGAVNYRARVWLNGQFLGENLDGFLPFEFELPAGLWKTTGNLLAVAVDNAHQEGDVPGMHVGWRGFGGIIREVELEASDLLRIAGLRIAATPTAGGGVAEFRVRVANDRAEAVRAGLGMVIRDAAGNNCAEIAVEPQEIKPGGVAEFAGKCLVAGASHWSPAAPALYTGTVSLLDTAAGREVDELGSTFGFRRIEATPAGLLLNGEPIFLTGFNRHEDSPRRIMATDLETTRADLEAMKAAGANLVRLCHYPHHPGELDLCDRLGLLVFAEIPLYFWNNQEDGRRNQPARVRAAARQLERLVARDFHHPSIIFWSVSNETPENEAAVAEGNRQLINHCRALDPTRLCVHVSNCWVQHPNFTADDVICVNAYPSIDWKRMGHNPAAFNGAEVAAVWRSNLEKTRRLFPGKPVLVTEFGYGSLPGTNGHALGEDEHSRVLEAEFAAFAPGLVCGALIWCWADHPWPAGRFLGGLGTSPFGVVSRNRNRLQPFHTASRLFRAAQGLRDPEKPAAPPRSTSVVMLRNNMGNLPEVPFPDGYRIRPMGIEDISLWTDIWRDAEPYIKITDDIFHKEFGDNLSAIGHRCFIVTDPRGLGIGTISAWYDRDFHGEDYGRIHWVAVRPSGQGKGLGKAMLAHAMRALACWHDRCYLVTSIERIPAIRLYMAFGFEPDMRHPHARENWEQFHNHAKPA